MFEPQNISATSPGGADAGAFAAARSQEVSPEIQQPTSFRGDDEREQSPEQNAARPDVEQQSAKSPRARLSYSLTENDTYVEILNPQTGDVIKRFPPEQAEDQLRTFSQGDAGIFLDQVA